MGEKKHGRLLKLYIGPLHTSAQPFGRTRLHIEFKTDGRERFIAVMHAQLFISEGLRHQNETKRASLEKQIDGNQTPEPLARAQ